VSVGTLQHLRQVYNPLPTSKEEVIHGLSCLSTCTLICLCDIDPIEVSIESGHASPEVSQTLASFHDNISYNCRVCFPGSAASTILACRPTFSGRPLLVAVWDRAMFRFVDFTRGTCACEVASSCVAVLAALSPGPAIGHLC
jgi:hypothetical protein